MSCWKNGSSDSERVKNSVARVNGSLEEVNEQLHRLLCSMTQVWISPCLNDVRENSQDWTLSLICIEQHLPLTLWPVIKVRDAVAVQLVYNKGSAVDPPALLLHHALEDMEAVDIAADICVGLGLGEAIPLPAALREEGLPRLGGVVVFMDLHDLPPCISKILGIYPVGRVGEDNVELLPVLVPHEGEGVDVEKGVLGGGEGEAHPLAQLGVPPLVLPLLQQLPSILEALLLRDLGVAEVLRDD